MVSQFGTDHEEFDLNPEEDLADAIEEFAYYLDEPSADAGALPVWYLSKMTRQKVIVALSGDGADELFGGFRGRGGLPTLTKGHDPIEFIRADKGIHFGDFLANIAAIAFHQATGDNQFASPADLLVFRHLEDGIDRFFLGGIDKAAGIHYQHFRLIGMGSQFVTFGHKLAHHDFTIDEIFGATQTDKTNFQAYIQAKRSDFSR